MGVSYGVTSSVAIRSVPSAQCGATVFLSEGEVDEGAFAVETTKPTQTQDGCSASVYPSYKQVNREFLPRYSETRVEQQAMIDVSFAVEWVVAVSLTSIADIIMLF
jgi:hypothetical protein